MPLNTKTIDQFVDDMVTGWAGATEADPSLRLGDPLLAFLETEAAQLSHLQFLIESVLLFSRSTTSSNLDLDDWMAQFAFTRLPAQKAKGTVKFGVLQVRTTETKIPPGTIVQTLTSDIQYEVIADTTKGAWNPTKNAYVIAPGQTEIEATVQALYAGTEYNVQPNQLSQFVSSSSGADTVTNSDSITNGSDAETDDDFRERFILKINNLEKGTVGAFEAEVLQLQAGLKVTILENQDINGNPLIGVVTVVVDDGSGSPPQSLLDLAAAALENIRPASIQVYVVGPIKVAIGIELDVKVKSGVVSADVRAAIRDAIVAYVNSLDIGETLYLSKIAAVALANTDVISIEPNSLKIDTVEMDKTVVGKETIRTDSLSVTVGSY